MKWILAALLVGCAGLTEPARAFAPPPVIVAFGDSLTAGYGAPQGESYPDFLQKDLDAAGYHYRVVNQGVSGDTTTDGLQRLSEVLAVKPAIVILEFGGNDGLHGVPTRATRENLNDLLRRLTAAKITVLLVGMTLPPNYGPDYIHAFQQMYTDLAAQYRLRLLPFIYQDLAPRLKNEPNLLQEDGIHATAAGNLLHPTMSAIDQAIVKGVLHENTGNRYKSRLTLAYNGLKAAK